MNKFMMKVTITINDQLYFRLKELVPSQQISKFISNSIQKELSLKEDSLLKAYEEAYSDPYRNEECEIWDILNQEILEKKNFKKESH
ncbi:hypothetical protein I862_07375 [endosymbiont of Acanthamoeba sp. UWC8]|uniref:hypothetical protein n=1 Tax=endosymbiont of Acanthamoeba sp. UWC8 TaxID=86106 RepID=UPI0004D1BBBD|nr:hypothetical protein [endosymbiont of Acanthamoeba sp. UWC8]AIF82029.1 hypothetical protein I862_07375 [endosymbiont of Acanthamoeba sp. UWC8]